jgi:hypothetical protein
MDLVASIAMHMSGEIFAQVSPTQSACAASRFGRVLAVALQAQIAPHTHEAHTRSEGITIEAHINTIGSLVSRIETNPWKIIPTDSFIICFIKTGTNDGLRSSS